ncbi:MAG: hypothetical protein ACRD1P_01520, partial [Thermoanaerobaculia bacterium]
MASSRFPKSRLLLLPVGVFVAASAAADERCMPAELQKALEAIATAPQIGWVYSRDGAADATIADHKQPSPLSEHVHRILECEGKSVPLLVEHLDSSRATTATIDDHPVSLGFICLDLLMLLAAHPSSVLIEDCHTDGLCACAVRGYCFDPSGLPIRDNNGQTHPSPTPAEVKNYWQRLPRGGSGHFVYPDFFEAQYYLVKAVVRYKDLG